MSSRFVRDFNADAIVGIRWDRIDAAVRRRFEEQMAAAPPPPKRRKRDSVEPKHVAKSRALPQSASELGEALATWHLDASWQAPNVCAALLELARRGLCWQRTGGFALADEVHLEFACPTAPSYVLLWRRPPDQGGTGPSLITVLYPGRSFDLVAPTFVSASGSASAPQVEAPTLPGAELGEPVVDKKSRQDEDKSESKGERTPTPRHAPPPTSSSSRAPYTAPGGKLLVVPSSSQRPLDSPALQMMRGMGWKDGTGLGQSSQGRVEPVSVQWRHARDMRGLAAGARPVLVGHDAQPLLPGLPPRDAPRTAEAKAKDGDRDSDKNKDRDKDKDKDEDKDKARIASKPSGEAPSGQRRKRPRQAPRRSSTAVTLEALRGKTMMERCVAAGCLLYVEMPQRARKPSERPPLCEEHADAMAQCTRCHYRWAVRVVGTPPTAVCCEPCSRNAAGTLPRQDLPDPLDIVLGPSKPRPAST